MGLSDLKKAPKKEQRPLLVIDLEPYIGEQAVLRFREPRAADYFPSADTNHKQSLQYPEFSAGMLKIVQLMAKCYESGPEDGDTFDAFKSFGDLAREQKELFMIVAGTFNTYYPLELEGNSVPND
jgi:hypothetical protein